MSKYYVELTAQANVRQYQIVEADSPSEAIATARQNANDNYWAYDEVLDDTVRCEEVEKREE